MTRRMQTLLAGVVILAVLLPVALTMTVPFVAEVPGPTINTIGTYNDKPVIDVQGKTPNRREGNLNLTTVGVISNISIVQAIAGWFSDSTSVVPTELVYPPNVPQSTTDKQNKADFTNSENSAIAAALGYLGYPDSIVVMTPPAKSPIAEGDAISSVDGQPVSTFDDLKAILGKTDPGTTVTVGYQHFGTPQTTTITTTKPQSGAGSLLGVVVTERPYAPFNVTFAQNDIGGPSAGLMLTLGIIDLVGPRSLTNGKFIAGTGTIDTSGNVGPIGGIQLKMKAARAAGAVVFFVPAGNCAEALQDHPVGLKMIKVNKLTDAMSSLKAFQAGKATPQCTG